VTLEPAGATPAQAWAEPLEDAGGARPVVVARLKLRPAATAGAD
jgi:hypothetical protein